MSNKTKIWLITASGLLVLGGLIFTSVLAVNDWDFTKISSVKYETNTYEITEEIENISIKTSTADIEFKYSGEDKCKVVFFEEEKIPHSAEVNGKTLTISQTDNRSWFDYIQFFSFGTTKITVYLPRDSYSSLNIETDTGDVNLPKELKFDDIKISGSTSDVSVNSSVTGLAEIELSTGDIKIEKIKTGELKAVTSTGDINLKQVECDGKISANVSTGDIIFSDITAKNFDSLGNTGDMKLKNVIIKEKMSLKRSTGDIKFDRCDAENLDIKTSTGDVSGSLLSEKIFITNTETGTVKVPETLNGGKCVVKTSTGDIIFQISS